MISHRVMSPILVAAICGGVLACAAADLRLGTSKGVLLLRNGSVLRGVIVQQGDQYIVSFGETGHARVPASNVERVCDDLEQVYRYRLAGIDGSLPSRIELARWCLQRNLLARAADQVLAAEAEHGNSPPVEALHQRLLLAARATRPARSQASATKPLMAAPRGAELLEQLGTEQIERFTLNVQPLLLNRCANSGCHSPRAGTSLVLLRAASSHSLTRRLTEQNLGSTLLQLNREQPLESPLLRQARSAHGGASEAPLTEHDVRQFQLLADWVSSVRPSARAAKPKTIVEPNDILLQAPVFRPAAPPAAAPESQTMQPAATSHYRPIDPFDPEVFNRRHHSSP